MSKIPSCLLLGALALAALPAAVPRVAPQAVQQSALQATTDPIRQTIQVPMRDGTLLATDVYLPAEKGVWPVLLMRTPYNKDTMKGIGEMARFGAAIVIQDVRGRFGSQGKDLPFMFDGWGAQQDGVDTCQWIGKQPWCSGKIVTAGGSALGITQVLTAGADPPYLVAQKIDVAPLSLYEGTHPGGAFCKALIEDWLQQNKFDPQALVLMRDHEHYDDYWRALDAGTRTSRVTAPGLFTGGWFDIFQQGLIDAFQDRQDHGGPGARGRQRLLIGPWPHGRSQKVGDLLFPANSMHPPASAEADWIPYWLLGKGAAPDPATAVTYYVMGDIGEPGAPGNLWRQAATWPPPSTSTPAYLASDGALSFQPPAAGAAPQSFTYNPSNPVPTRGGQNLTIPAGPMDQRPVENRPDVLLFTSPALDKPVEITGRVKAKLWVSSDAPDTDFTVKLTDVYPDGRSMLLLDGIRRMRFRNGFEKPELIKPGTVYPITVDLWSTSMIINTGHRIRIALSSSNYPRFDANPNNGQPSWAGGPVRVAHNTVYVDASRPSQVVLPVVSAPAGR